MDFAKEFWRISCFSAAKQNIRFLLIDICLRYSCEVVIKHFVDSIIRHSLFPLQQIILYMYTKVSYSIIMTLRELLQSYHKNQRIQKWFSRTSWIDSWNSAISFQKPNWVLNQSRARYWLDGVFIIWENRFFPFAWTISF